MGAVCSRRSFLATMGAAVLPATPAARAEPGRQHRAADFVDSVGINTHLSSATYAGRYPLVRDLLATLHIRHVRDELRPNNDLGRWRELNEHLGIRSHLLVSPVTNTVDDSLDYIARLGAQRICAVEGQNEGNSDYFIRHPVAKGNWAETVVAYQREIYGAIKSLHPTIPVVSPTVINWKPDDIRALRDAAPFCDVVAIHPYVQGGQEPETGDAYAALNWYLRVMRDPLKPNAPVMATEVGYDTLPTHINGMSELGASVYTPRMLLNNYAAGIKRTFLYQLLDSGSDPANAEVHWGLVRDDNTQKPAFHAVAQLLSAFIAAGEGAAASTPLTVKLAEAPEDIRFISFAAAGEDLLLALWRAARVWDPQARRDLPVSAAIVEVVPSRRVSRVEFLTPGKGADWAELPIARRGIALNVGAAVILVRLTVA